MTERKHAKVINGVLVYQDFNSLLAEVKTNVLGVEQPPRVFTPQRPLKNLYDNSGVPVRVHLFIIQDDGQYYHASSSSIDLTVEDQRLLSKEDGQRLYSEVSSKSIYYFKRLSKVVKRHIFYFAIPLANK